MSTHQPLTVGIIGCGAVAQLYYAPALKTLERQGHLRVTTAHDPNSAALSTFRTELPGARAAASVAELLELAPQLVIVASPPQHHAEHAVAALRAGADVHCEKPLAPSLADGERMVTAAEETGRRLSVGMLRRHFPATQAIGRLIASGALGTLTSIQCFEGGPFDWPVQSAEYFRRAAGNAGVLQDIGTHCVDLLVWWLGVPTEVTYHDDAMGGVEANCRVELVFGDVRATVRLSRDWARPNRYVITGTHGWIGWTANESDHFDLGIAGSDNASDYVGAVALHHESTTNGGRAVGRPAAAFDEAFANQLRALVDPTAAHEVVSGAAALATVRIIEQCYATRTPMSMPWLAPREQPA